MGVGVIPPAGFSLVNRVGRVPSVAAPLNARPESRIQRIVEESITIDPEQSIHCVLDLYDYTVRLVGVDQIAIGADTSTGDMVDLIRIMPGRTGPAPHLNGPRVPGGRQLHYTGYHSPRQRPSLRAIAS